jgi:hypothetical protein|uniref:hypothetical protein n=1 Tax=Succinivibrio sp. TaxID=2053619 RepID=UPI002060DBEF|nr:MAG TPA: Head decoration protein, Viral protein.5A [Caudoviricetes sp.]
MTKQLYRRIGEWKPDDLLADSRDIYITTDEAIDAGASFHRGQIVKYDSTTKTIKAMTAKSDIPFGIVVRDVNCSENEDENGDLFATVYVRGSFNGQSSLLDAGAIPAEDTSHKATPLSFEDFYVALRERGIIIRRNVN